MSSKTKKIAITVLSILGCFYSFWYTSFTTKFVEGNDGISPEEILLQTKFYTSTLLITTVILFFLFVTTSPFFKKKVTAPFYKLFKKTPRHPLILDTFIDNKKPKEEETTILKKNSKNIAALIYYFLIFNFSCGIILLLLLFFSTALTITHFAIITSIYALLWALFSTIYSITPWLEE